MTFKIFFNFQKVTIIFVYSEVFSVCSKYAETKLHKWLRTMEIEISINILQIEKEVSYWIKTLELFDQSFVFKFSSYLQIEKLS